MFSVAHREKGIPRNSNSPRAHGVIFLRTLKTRIISAARFRLERWWGVKRIITARRDYLVENFFNGSGGNADGVDLFMRTLNLFKTAPPHQSVTRIRKRSVPKGILFIMERGERAVAVRAA